MTCQSNGTAATITPVRPPRTKRTTNPTAKRKAVVQTGRPAQIVTIHATICTPAGTAMSMLAALKTPSACAAMPTANMWCTQTPKLMTIVVTLETARAV